ncbi:protein Flattop [Aulostomus maculatus]
MSSNYSANQYDGAFRSRRLQNWCQTKPLSERPTAQRGHTTFIANDRGHLLPGRGSAWPDFKSTWDLPARIPACSINPTARSVEGLDRLKAWGFDPQHTKNICLPRSEHTESLQDAGEKKKVDVQQNGTAPSPLVQSTASPHRPVTADQRPPSQNQDSSVALPADRKPAAQDNCKELVPCN